MAKAKTKAKASAAGPAPTLVDLTVEEFLALDAVDAQVVEFRVRVAREAGRLREAARVGPPAIGRDEEGTITEAILSAYFAAGGTLAGLGALLAGPGAGRPDPGLPPSPSRSETETRP